MNEIDKVKEALGNAPWYFFVVLIVIFLALVIPIVHEKKADSKYGECMQHKAEENCGLEGHDTYELNPWQGYYICDDEIKQIVGFTNEEINTCWDKSGSWLRKVTYFQDNEQKEVAI